MKEDKYPSYFTANVIIYNDEFINYRHAIPVSIDSTPRFIEYDSDALGGRQQYVISNTITMETGTYEELENIQLDPTLMKRIAVFNKEQECKRLDKEIEEKKEQIKELDNLLKDKEKRWQKVKEYIANIYELDIDNDYEDYDDEDEDY